ncbi:MAG: DUF1501 domain-containing protein [Gemmataceae bacterium]|nr:DUF1501 domain-containing protein [Gemmataceae bacterium]
MSRRDWLARTGWGFGGLALSALLGDEARAASTAAPHHPAKAKRVIHIFLDGGPSHLDTFDPKPKLRDHAGKAVKSPHDDMNGNAFASPFTFAKHGQSGLEISDAFPELAKRADDLCVIRSMHTDDPSHENQVLMMNCGHPRLARPSVGSWVTHGLGSANRNLPAFVALYHGGPPLKGAENWQAAFLPGSFQGTAVDTQHAEIDKLLPFVKSPVGAAADQRQQLDALAAVNRRHAAGRADPRLEARIESFELAYRMQTEAAETFDLGKESPKVRDWYGDTPAGRQCLQARRLVEKGVRFVQVFNSGWDHHSDLADGLKNQAKDLDKGVAALLADLRQRGLLDDTLVVCCGEFGRTPTADGDLSGVGKGTGRGHNHRGFTAWLAGGGVKGGQAVGATDELGFAAVENKVHVHDLHATVLHLLGLDHEKLTYRYSGRDFRLTDVSGRVVREVLA